MYHDIGKINNPRVFGENQNGENIHDELEPKTSYQLITRHVGDGILILLQIPDMDIKLLNIISQHHGNTVLKYFYDKANIPDIEKYRYKCSTPSTLEAAVIMIADSVEATAKGLYSNGKINSSEDKKNVIENSIRRLVDDGQLDELKVGHLKKIKSVLFKELETLYHKREVYEEKD
jgi:membrane-associated HD superfamily phosphohydrolase